MAAKGKAPKRSPTKKVASAETKDIYLLAKSYNIHVQRVTAYAVEAWCEEFPGVKSRRGYSPTAVVDVYLGVVDRLKDWPKGIPYPEAKKTLKHYNLG